MESYKKGDEVSIVKDREGFIRYIGEVDGKKGLFYGIEVKVGKGKHNGEYREKKYFDCKPGSGVFIKQNHILFKINDKSSKSSKNDEERGWKPPSWTKEILEDNVGSSWCGEKKAYRGKMVDLKSLYDKAGYLSPAKIRKLKAAGYTDKDIQMMLAEWDEDLNRNKKKKKKKKKERRKKKNDDDDDSKDNDIRGDDLNSADPTGNDLEGDDLRGDNALRSDNSCDYEQKTRKHGEEVKKKKLLEDERIKLEQEDERKKQELEEEEAKEWNKRIEDYSAYLQKRGIIKIKISRDNDTSTFGTNELEKIQKIIISIGGESLYKYLLSTHYDKANKYIIQQIEAIKNNEYKYIAKLKSINKIQNKNGLCYEMKMDLDYNKIAVKNENFENELKDEIASILGLHSSLINVDSVKEGSIITDFTIKVGAVLVFFLSGLFMMRVLFKTKAEKMLTVNVGDSVQVEYRGVDYECKVEQKHEHMNKTKSWVKVQYIGNPFTWINTESLLLDSKRLSFSAAIYTDENGEGDRLLCFELNR